VQRDLDLRIAEQRIQRELGVMLAIEPPAVKRAHVFWGGAERGEAALIELLPDDDELGDPESRRIDPGVGAQQLGERGGGNEPEYPDRGRRDDLLQGAQRGARRLSDFRPASLLLAKPPDPTRGTGQNLGDLYTNWSHIGPSDHIPGSMKGAVSHLAA